jgi:hypothetical protein
MSHSTAALAQKMTGQRSSQCQRSEAGRDIGDAMSRCPQYRCAGLAAPEGTELQLADGPHRDFLVDRCGCGEQFGSAVCAAAPPIAHIFRHNQELDAELAGDPFRAVKRACLECGHPIANWHNGRRVSKATKFCGPRCQRKAAKKAGGPSGEGQATLCVQTAKRPPFSLTQNQPPKMPRTT